MVAFNLNLVTANDDLNQNLKSNPVTYLISPDQQQVMLCSNNRNQVANFIISDLPPFLGENNGLYLGDVYYPMLSINGQSYFLEQTVQDNVYNLVLPDNVLAVENLFSVAFLSPDLQWDEEDTIDNLMVENFNLDKVVQNKPLEGYFVRGSAGQFIYSAAVCPEDCEYCGNNCPDDYFCTGTECATDNDGVGFGVRGDGFVYSYKIDPNQETVMVAASDQSLITADIETSDIVRERFFYADYQGDEDNFVVGKDYPIYVWVGDQKKYLSNPNRLQDNGPTIYELTNQPQPDGALFSPTTPANWRERELTPDDFINFAFNNSARLALWNDPSFIGTAAVVDAPTILESEPVVPPPIPNAAPFATPVTAPFRANGTAGTAGTGEPFWRRWWFWLIITIVLLMLFGLVLFFALRKPAPKTTVVTPAAATKPVPTYINSKSPPVVNA